MTERGDRDSQLNTLLRSVLNEPRLIATLRDALVQHLLVAPQECEAFGVTANTAEATVIERSHLLRQIYPQVQQVWGDRPLHQQPLETLWRLWLPLALQLATMQDKLDRPLIQGILGGQGTGKTTLAAMLKLILNQMGKQVCCLSLDDLYKTYADRQQLQQADPRLRWRGPPGTHDVNLGLQVLQRLRQGYLTEPIEIPRFDKSAWNGMGDRTTPERVSSIDILLFEGWFVGVRPTDPSAFDTAPSPIETESDRQFARDCNARLHDYVPLWDQLDHLMVLHPTDYRLSQQWRREAEQQMVASGRSGMSDDEINQFVEYFWRSLHPQLFIEPLVQEAIVDLVVEINPDHTVGKIRGREKKENFCLS
ncbi:glycerate kinase [Oscillatoria sp. FACHB-1407]|uniref:glycerate kinase n=1 Tax=Oscillatoria sp. FACHB-1407 TaxID=2692847 RepID=UPI001683871E|nr:glycerate kinase [Oscillatoria sp. FACHB-1407]MBD2460578.1 glycerate kinase [Oscillatoria sp. FACHB-1407]